MIMTTRVFLTLHFLSRVASHEFQIADDNEILKRLGMHKCRKQVREVLLVIAAVWVLMF